MKSSRQKFLVYLLILVGLGAGAYYYSIYSQDIAISDIVGESSTEAVVGEDILVLVQKLQSVNIDPSVFSNAIFTNLVDFSVPLGNENKSRPNPFAPIGTDVGVVR